MAQSVKGSTRISVEPLRAEPQAPAGQIIAQYVQMYKFRVYLFIYK